MGRKRMAHTIGQGGGRVSELYPVSSWRVTCSVCHQEAPPAETISGAVALAEDAGWEVVEIRGQRITLCPSCAQRRMKVQP